MAELKVLIETLIEDLLQTQSGDGLPDLRMLLRNFGVNVSRAVVHKGTLLF